MAEVFRFMALRPAEAVDLDASNHVETKNSESTFQKKLEDAVGSKNAVEKMLKHAKQFMASENYVSYLNQLSIQLKEFGDRLRKESLSVEDLNNVILDVFEKDAEALVESEAYVIDRRNIADSLIALVITKNEDIQNYEDLLQAIRLCGLLERVATKDATLNSEEAIKDALNQTVLLPEDIFPLTEHQVETGTMEEQETKRKGRREIGNAEKSVERLENLKKALNELKTVRSSDFREIERLNEEESGREAVAQPPMRPWILTEEAINRVTSSSKKEIANLGISLNAVSVPELTLTLESAIIDVGAEVYKANESTNVVKVGSTIFKVPAISYGDTVGLVSGTSSVGAFRAIGVADLMVVKQEIQKYEPGEVAHIENILKGEFKKRTHRKTKRTEETYLTEEETIEESERDLQSTDRFEMQKETQETIKKDSKFGLDVTVKYGGFVDVTANTKYSTEKASEKSKKRSTNYARDVTERSVNRIQERVREQRIRKTIVEIEEENIHEIDNKKQDADHIVGIYRWVDKIYKSQVYNYGERLMFEFIVPEPAAFTIFASSKKTPEGLTLTEPLVPKNPKGNGLLEPQHVLPENYQSLVAQYQVSGVEPPPPLYTHVFYSYKTSEKVPDFKKSTDISNNAYLVEGEKDSETLTAPPGYVIVDACGTIDVPHWQHYESDWASQVTVTIGTKLVRLAYHNSYLTFSNLNIGNDQTKVPVVVSTFHKSAVTISVDLLCRREDALKKWQIETYEAIMSAYLNLKSEYEEQLAAVGIQAGIAISGRNPKLNRELEKTELKKGAITLLTRKTSPHLNFAGSVVNTENDLINPQKNQEYYKDYPEIDFDEADREAPYIQFFEQAFEWTQIMYTFYPYFWARKKKWPILQQIQDNDPLHAQFLQAGAARVLVPVRQSYEDSVLYYLETGKVWNGAGPPSVSSPLYLSLVKTIKEQQGIYFSKREGFISVTKGSKVVKGKETKFSSNDVDREIVIRNKKYRIAEVKTTEELILSEKYLGNSENDIFYSIGLILVDEPWEVKVPTSLVWLQKSADLPDFTQQS